ncbi:hypothetical protein WM42_0637 [Corynebacterium simulans]|uniref:Uncharacterized protein n=1 Tax=Corynebacterium simulans TaxID=146827 RepID=A0ABR5VBD8_9CORY|nr:hypothetical protein WM42_0637 [Corynebacterium simulans]KXU18644.1 hypothetical protein WM41_0700 [Corynebacterium simulans]
MGFGDASSIEAPISATDLAASALVVVLGFSSLQTPFL